MLDQAIRGPLLIPRTDGSVLFHPDGLLAADAAGTLQYAGPWDGIAPQFPPDLPVRPSDGVMLPPLLDLHIHIPQHPIRGDFVKGIPDDAPDGKLLNGLKQNVFPAEARCNDPAHAERVVRTFLADTLAHGVVGGAAYMTPSVAATEVALSLLPDTWSVGLVLMNRDSPPDLRTEEATLEADVERLAARFGPRLIVTDRFAVAVDTPLRRRGAALAARLGLRTQTHLNEQRAEKAFVEQTLYPGYASYTDVYRRDGLLDHRCILAHCIQMTPDEWRFLRDTGSVVAHCPTSNLLLGSGVMPLDDLLTHGIPYALATDVGASPTVSMLAEMARFLQLQSPRSPHATPAEALYRSTLAPAQILDLAPRLGHLALGRSMSFIEVVPVGVTRPTASADEVIRSLLPANLARPVPAVTRVTLQGRPVFTRGVPHE